MKDDYLTVGDLRKVLARMPDDAKVFYQRIEDVYFDQHGWKADKLVPFMDTKPEDNINEEYLRAFAAFPDGEDLLITAHY